MIKRNALEQSIFKSIFQLSNRIQVEGDKITDELTLKQWLLLLILYKSKIADPTINDIAASMCVTRQSTKKMVSILENRGYLAVTKSASDRRALSIRPTQKVYDFFKKNKLFGFELIEQLFQDITEEELTLASQVLHKMQKNLNTKSENETSLL